MCVCIFVLDLFRPGRPWESGQDRDPLRIYPVPQPQRGGDFGGDLGPNFGPFGPLPGTG